MGSIEASIASNERPQGSKEGFLASKERSFDAKARSIVQILVVLDAIEGVLDTFGAKPKPFPAFDRVSRFHATHPSRSTYRTQGK